MPRPISTFHRVLADYSLMQPNERDCYMPFHLLLLVHSDYSIASNDSILEKTDLWVQMEWKRKFHRWNIQIQFKVLRLRMKFITQSL